MLYCYVSNAYCSSLFKFNEEVVPPELRAQRILNRAHMPDISSYLINNSTDYTLSSLTASVDAKVDFDPISRILVLDKTWGY